MPPKINTAPPATKIRVFLVDDHPLLRQGIAGRIGEESDMTVCGQAGSAAEALPAIASTKPNVVIVDISLPGRDGIELTKDIKARHRAMVVLVLSMHDESLYAERALRAGAAGYLMKSAPTETLIQAIHKIVAGEIFVGPHVVSRLLTRAATGAREASASPLECITNRELEIFRLLGRGQSCRAIAQQLHLSVKTIETHQSNMCQKLGLSTSNQLRKFAAEFLYTEAAGSARP